jgi:sortase (surface protein transpeptidase)
VVGSDRLKIALVAVTLAVLTGCGAPPDTTIPRAEPSLSATAESTSNAPGGLPRSVPVRLDIPSISAHSTLVPLGLNLDHTVQVPPVSTPMQAGWYEFGPTPGEIGPAVILGHVDGDKQPGIFYHLRDVPISARIDVTRADGRIVTYFVRHIEQIAKDEFPRDAVYGDTSEPELRLITCGGSFDRSTRNYRDNIIVYATL